MNRLQLEASGTGRIATANNASSPQRIPNLVRFMCNIIIQNYDGTADAIGSCLLVRTSPSAGQSITREAVKWRPIAAESIFKRRYDVHIALIVYIPLDCIRETGSKHL